MAKTKRQIAEDLKLIDVIIEILDARIPVSSQNPDMKQLIKNKKRIYVLNKSDLADERETSKWIQKFKGKDSSAISTDSNTGNGIAKVQKAIEEIMSDEIKKYEEKGRKRKSIRVLVLGIPNVGKSSLIRELDPSLDLKVGEISAYHLQGKHTTTFYQMHPISSGGFVIDTPGIRGFGLVDVNELELSGYFPEMLRVEDNCKFAPCTHTHEPGCAVKEGVENGTISPERYESYLGMLDEEDGGKYR